MKKLFFVMAAVAALLTSCSKDDTLGGPTRGKVTFEVSTPELATRYGEGTTATNLQYAVYDMVEDATNGRLVDTGTATLNDKHAIVSIDLVEGRKYTAIFWADAGENASPYTFTPATKTVSYTNVNDLTANNEAYDAFYAFVPQADIKVGQTVNVTLKRPFAQLRIETSDTDRARKLGVEVVKTGITVNAYTSFNLETGAVDGQQNITFKPTDKASASTTLGEVTYDLISMNYVLVNTREMVDVTLNFTDDVNGTEQNYVRQYNAVQVQRNHRTLVRGTILTDPTEFDVTVSEGFDGDINEEHNTSETLVVSTADDIREAFENLNDNDPSNDPGTIVLGDDIDLGSGDWTSIFGYDNSASLSTMTRTGEDQDPSVTIKKDQVLTLDLNGFTLSGISKQTGKNYDMIDVRGTLTVKNGTITTKHEGANMEWNASTNVFNVTAGGVLNLIDVTAKNLGGSDMAFVAHLNNWGEVTLNVENSTLESNYVAVRVFNSGNDMNNVTIKNSTLKGGSYAFWVHNYTDADFGTQEKAEAQKALLNLDIFNGTNTFTGKNDTPIRYGMTNSIYVDANGSVGVDADKKNYYIYDAAGLKWVAAEVNKVDAQAPNIFDDATIYLDNDIDLAGEEWTPIGDYAFSRTVFRGTFDGQGHTIFNFKISQQNSRKDKVTEASYGLFGNTSGIIKNLTIEDAVVAPNGGRFAGVLVGRLKENGLIDNCHVKNSTVTIEHWQVGGIVGQIDKAGNIKDSSIESSTITGYAAVGAIAGLVMNAGEYTIENCDVNGCDIVQNGSFGDGYDGMFGLIIGAINNKDAIVNIDDCEVANNTIKGVGSDCLAGYISEGAKLYIDGKSEAQLALEAAIAAAEDGATVTLSADLTLTQTLVIPEGKNITLDLNGKTITGTMHKNDGAVLNNKATLTIVGGTIKNTAENGEATIINEGDLTLSGAEIIGAPIGNTGYPSYALYTNGGKLVVEDNTKITSDRGAIYIYNGADVTINGGEIKVTNAVGSRTLTAHVIYAYGSSSKLTINDGNFTMNIANGGGTSVICPAGATIAVNGGYFYHATTADAQSGVFQNYMGYGAPVDVYGGTYNDKTVEKNLAAGYKVVDNGNGTWSVVAE